MSGIFKKEKNLSNLNKYNNFSQNSSDEELDINRGNVEYDKNKSGNKFYSNNPDKDNDRVNRRNFSQTTKNAKLDRVRKLSEKLSNIQIKETPNPGKLNKLETKLQLIDENYSYSLRTLKTKYNTLKEHTDKMREVLDSEKMNKDELRKNVTEKLNNLQTRVKTFLMEEKDHFKEYTENITNKLEAELIRCEIDVKKDEDSLLKNLNDIKDNIKVNIIFFP